MVDRAGPPKMRTTPYEVKHMMNTSRLAEEIAVRNSGKVTVRKVRIVEAPSVCAASSK